MDLAFKIDWTGFKPPVRHLRLLATIRRHALYIAVPVFTLLITAGLILTAATQAEARCYDIGTPQFRCDPIVSESLQRRYEASRNLPAYQPRRRSRFELQSYTAATGAARRTYRYRNGRDNQRHGKILDLPGGAAIHKGNRHDLRR